MPRLPLLAVLPTAVAAAPLVEDAGASLPGSPPRALLVVSPGLQARETDALVEAIEAEGVDVFRIAFPVERQHPAEMRAAIRDGMVALGPGPVGLVGHGTGGTLAVQAQAEHGGAAAVAVLAAPLRAPGGRLVHWLLEQPPPALGLDLGDAATQAETWNEQPALALLLGEPLPALTPVSEHWLAELRRWGAPAWQAPTAGLGVPLWAGAGTVDNLAPPESVRGALPGDATFVRFGLMHLDGAAPSHVDLLRRPKPAAVLGAWLRTRLRSYAGPSATPED
jgi:hypothetical protein